MPNYRVVFREEVVRTYEVENCRTPEEAEAVANDLREEDYESEQNSYMQGNTDSTLVATEIEELEEA